MLRLLLFFKGAPWETQAQSVYLKADPGGYHQLALNLLRTGRYAFMPDPIPEQVAKSMADPKLWRLPGEPEALWPPLYTLFIAGIYSRTGVQIAAVLLTQILLSLLVALLVYWVSLQLFKRESLALLAALLFAIEPTMILLPNTMYSDFIFILFLSILYFVFVRNIILMSSGTVSRWILWSWITGVVLGLACLTHVRGVIFFPIILLVILVTMRSVSLRWRFFSMAMVATGYLMSTGYWYWRNYRIFGEWAFSTASSYNLLIGASMVAPVEKREESIEWVFRQARLRMEEQGDPFKMNPFTRARIWRRTALDLIREHPTEYLKAHLKRMITVAFVPGTSEYEAILTKASQTEQFKLKEGRLPRMGALRWILFVWVVLWTLFLYSMGIWGVLTRGKEVMPITWFVLITCAVLWLTSISNTHPRMRAPILLLLLPYSGAGLGCMRERVSTLFSKQSDSLGSS